MVVYGDFYGLLWYLIVYGDIYGFGMISIMVWFALKVGFMVTLGVWGDFSVVRFLRR